MKTTEKMRVGEDEDCGTRRPRRLKGCDIVRGGLWNVESRAN